MAEVATHSCAWVRGVLDLFASQGVDTAWLLDEARIDPARLSTVHERFSLADVDRLWSAALARTGQSALGLDQPLAHHYVHFELAQQAMWSSHDLGSGLVVLSEYLALINDASAFRIVSDRGDRWLVFDDGRDSPRQRVEFMMLATQLLCQRATRRRVGLLAAEFVFPEPADLHPYRMAFQCPLRFGQDANRLRVGKEDLATPIVSGGHSLFAVQDRVIEQRLTRTAAGARTTYRAAEEMVRRLHLGDPRPQDLALSLGLTEAEFERKLRADGQTFELLLDGVRKDLAEQYLRQPGYEPQQIATLLGWETAAQLTSACKRWFGFADEDEFPQIASAVRARAATATAAPDSTQACETVPMLNPTS